MKIRIEIPYEFSRKKEVAEKYIDDILLWGMETEMDIAFYGWHQQPGARWITWQYAVFTVEADYSYMFSLRWGAVLHKPRVKKQLIKEK